MPLPRRLPACAFDPRVAFRYNFSHRRNKKFERKQRDFYKNQTDQARQRFAESKKRHFEPTHRERRLHQWGVGALMSPKLPTSDW